MKDWDLPTNVKSEELEPREKKKKTEHKKLLSIIHGYPLIIHGLTMDIP